MVDNRIHPGKVPWELVEEEVFQVEDLSPPDNQGPLAAVNAPRVGFRRLALE